ncbi:MAG: hypothetical protein IT331_19095 [Anaerolineae bacterium]|nr:hypothetical protein [Anaerolineae bacterium]
MVQIEQIARAALSGDSLQTRSLTRDFMQQQEVLEDLPRPRTTDARVIALAASLAELFALRTNQPAPKWAKTVGAIQEPVYLAKSALAMKRLRKLCETESPPPLRKRKFFAPPNYLEFA